MKKGLYAATMAFLFAAAAMAMPFRPGLVDANGYSKELGRYLEHKKEPGLDQPGPVPRLAPGDTIRAIVILIDFTDSFADTNNHPGWRYQQMLFDGPWATQTLQEYYHEISYGDFTVTGEVTAIWYRASHGHDYYGNINGSARAAALVKEACQAADAAINFSLYDSNNDGYVDALFVIHQGPGREETGSDYDIHSHRWRLDWAGVGNYTTGEGKICRDYSIEPEMHNSSTYSNVYNKIITVGVFCHEYGHVLGLPDLYDTDYSSDGLGNYCLMSGGSWGGNGQSPSRPVQMCPWSKSELGWLTPENVPANVAGKKLPPVESSRSVYKVWKSGSPGQQYFLVENRQRQGFDALLPNDGLLIYHVDESQSGNTNDNRRLVDLESASADTANKDHLDVAGGSGADAGDYWPGLQGKTAFDPFSNADSRSNTSPYLTMVAAYNIRPGDADTMLLDFFVGGSQLSVTGSQLNDAAGNGNGIAEPGEPVGLTVTLANASGWSNATSVTGTLTTADTSVTITKSTAAFPNINAGSSGTCAADSFAFTVSPGALPHRVTFLVTKSCAQGAYPPLDSIMVPVMAPRVLLVDDDADTNYQVWYQPVFDTLNVLYTTWTVADQGPVPLDTLLAHPVTVWFTGNDSTAALAGSDTANLKAFLDAGNKLFISSKQLGQQLGGTGFYADYLHASYLANSSGQIYVRGVPGNPVGLSLADTLVLGGSFGANNATSLDRLAPVGGADSAFVYRNTGGAAAITYDGAYKLAYFGFPYEAIGGMSPRYKQRTEIMRRILNWFGGVLPTGVGSGLQRPQAADPGLKLSAAPSPFSNRTIISFELEKETPVSLSIYNGLGQRLSTVYRGTLKAGRHSFAWNGRDRSGRAAASGVYFARLEEEGRGRATSRLIKIR